MRLRPTEGVKKNGDFAGSLQPDIAPPMCSPTIHGRHMVVVPDLFVGAMEGFVAYLAMIFRLEPPIQQVVVLEPLLVVVEPHRLVREL